MSAAPWPADMPGRIARAMSTGETLPEDDVSGIALMFPGGWPCYLVELGIGGFELQRLVGGDLVGLDVAFDTLHNCGMRPAANMLVPPESDGPIRWVVQQGDRPRRASGIYAPRGSGSGHWEVITPLPPWPDEFSHLMPRLRWQIGVYVTTRTTGLWQLHGQALVDALMIEADAGRLYGTRAAVV